MKAKETRFRGVSFYHEDIHSVVDAFYRKVEKDPLLREPFHSVHDWPEHIKKLTHFWWMRLGGEPYMFAQYNPVAKHFFAGFNRLFLTRWLELFHETIDDKLNPEQADLWKSLSSQMGEGLFMGNELFKKRREAEGDVL